MSMVFMRVLDIVVHQHSASFTQATRHSGRNVDTQNADIDEGHECKWYMHSK